MRHIRRGGSYFRVADPDWSNPLGGSHAARSGGRWNPPNSFLVVYLNGDVRVARANVARKFRGRPYGPELLEPREAPVLIETTVAEADYVDIITEKGCADAGLPREYPNDASGGVVGWEQRQPIGIVAWDSGERGIACRSAAPSAPQNGEELAWFARTEKPSLRALKVLPFDDWFW